MTDSTADGFDSAAPVPRTAGGLLRAARQAQGLHIAALAASIKVVPRKLEWLEADQFDQLPDATFTRALAQTVCRTLKIDPAPVLALLPPMLGNNRLAQVANGLNTPFHERPGRLVTQQWSGVASPALWIALALVVAAAAVYLVPAQWFAVLKPAAARAPAGASDAASSATSSVEESGMAVPAGTSSAEGAAEAASSSVSLIAEVPAASSAARPTSMNALNTIGATGNSSGMPAAAPRADSLPEPGIATAPPPGMLQLHAKAASWIDVTDARGQTLLARLLQPNESVTLDGVMPFKLKVGNARAVTVVFRGEPVLLESSTRDNVARLVLK